MLIPLGAAAFHSVGRHPLAGAAAFAGVAAGFGVNFLITPIDGVLTEITNEALGSGPATHHIDLVSNLYFGIGSAIFIVIVTTIVTARFIERRLGAYDPAAAGEDPEDPIDHTPEVRPADEARGLRYAMWGALAVIVAVALLTAMPGAPLRNPQPWAASPRRWRGSSPSAEPAG